jgi:ribonuclease HII
LGIAHLNFYYRMETSTFILEKDFASQGFTHVIGTDEVGRGPLCGPVVACAAMYRGDKFPELSSESELSSEERKKWDLIRDSKKLSEKQREEIFDFIGEHFYLGLGLCDHETIDRINILEASFLAMKKAIQALLRQIPNDKLQIPNKFQDTNSNNQNSNTKEKLESKIQNQKSIVLVDGNKIIPNLSMEQYAVIGGDKLVKSISAASIVAKVTRDRMMKEFAVQYPGYGMEKHMGYGTKVHMEALIAQGPCPIHRKSFAPVKRALKKI